VSSLNARFRAVPPACLDSEVAGFASCILLGDPALDADTQQVIYILMSRLGAVVTGNVGGERDDLTRRAVRLKMYFANGRVQHDEVHNWTQSCPVTVTDGLS
jgi:hypothetical protein